MINIYLLVLKFIPDRKWKSYICAIVKMLDGWIVGFFYRSRKFIIPAAILYLYRHQIKPIMEDCCHSLVLPRPKGSFSTEFYPPPNYAAFWVSKYSPPLSHRRSVGSLSLIYLYCYDKYSNELYSFFPPVQTFTANIRHVHGGKWSPFPSCFFDNKQVPLTQFLSKNC